MEWTTVGHSDLIESLKTSQKLISLKRAYKIRCLIFLRKIERENMFWVANILDNWEKN